MRLRGLAPWGSEGGARPPGPPPPAAARGPPPPPRPQRGGTLDYLIERLAERPVARLDPPVLAALRLGMYELLYLDGAPDHAVVADAVELAKTSGRGGHGLVNAVLRRATREGRALLDALDDRTPEHAAVLHSHPPWLARMWWQDLGPQDARALMAYDNEPGEVALRANTLVTDA